MSSREALVGRADIGHGDADGAGDVLPSSHHRGTSRSTMIVGMSSLTRSTRHWTHSIVSLPAFSRPGHAVMKKILTFVDSRVSPPCWQRKGSAFR
ncbi:MAG: hypothetical protein MZV64_71295 [Ignavibacteriales bacterium]|nr:hypothetical protein [Ignavibacteriales bacterium]